MLRVVEYLQIRPGRAHSRRKEYLQVNKTLSGPVPQRTDPIRIFLLIFLNCLCSFCTCSWDSLNSLLSTALGASCSKLGFLAFSSSILRSCSLLPIDLSLICSCRVYHDRQFWRRNCQENLVKLFDFSLATLTFRPSISRCSILLQSCQAGAMEHVTAGHSRTKFAFQFFKAYRAFLHHGQSPEAIPRHRVASSVQIVNDKK